MTTATRERIETENEKYGIGFLDDNADGAWVVQARTYDAWCLAAIFTNREAAESYIHEHVAEYPERTLDDYRLEVWAAHDTYPWPDDEEGETA